MTACNRFLLMVCVCLLFLLVVVNCQKCPEGQYEIQRSKNNITYPYIHPDTGYLYLGCVNMVPLAQYLSDLSPYYSPGRNLNDFVNLYAIFQSFLPLLKGVMNGLFNFAFTFPDFTTARFENCDSNSKFFFFYDYQPGGVDDDGYQGCFNYFIVNDDSFVDDSSCPGGVYAGSGAFPLYYNSVGMKMCGVPPLGTWYNASVSHVSDLSIKQSRLCNAGFYCLAGSTSSTQFVCPIGKFSTAGSSSCFLCAKGFYGGDVGMTSSVCSGSCQGAPGYFCDAGSSSPKGIECPVGTFNDGSVVAACLSCPIGTYGNRTGLSNNKCSGILAGGYYSNSAGHTSSNDGTLCPQGYFCPPGAATKIPCFPGSFSKVGFPSCLPCAAGTFSNQALSSSCSNCAEGFFGNISGLSVSTCSGSCSTTTPGYFCYEGTTSTDGVVCPAGFYCLAGIKNACPAGSFGSTSGLTSANCSGYCSAGFWGNTGGLSTSNCSSVCLAGYFCPVGSTSGLICPVGSYCPEKSSNYTLCPTGSYGSVLGLTSSICSGSCSSGYYGNQLGATSSACSGKCNVGGYFCKIGSVSATETLCPMGSFCNFGVPSLCAAGLFGNSTGLSTSACSGVCLGGFYGATEGMTSAECSGYCAAGYYCTAGSTFSTATVCPIGTYSTTGASSLSNCLSCPGGYYGDSSALSNYFCSGKCDAGYFCPAGSISKSSSANVCPVGTYSISGSSFCSFCQAGFYGKSIGLTSSDCSGPCDAGYYGSISGLTSATCSGRCQNGFYCPSGSTSSTPSNCPVGSYSLIGTSCVQCPAGTYGNTTGLTSPFCSGVCPVGSFSTSPGNSACIFCPAGTYGIITGETAISCSGLCLPGFFGNITGLFTATCSGVCESGYYCLSGSTSSTQNICLPGSFSLAGSSHCSLCPVGKFGNSAGLTSANCSGSCQIGFYGSEAGLTISSCSGSCSAGYFCESAATSPISQACALGKYSLGGTNYCSDCPVGTYGGTFGLTSAACSGPIVAGYYSPDSRVTSQYGSGLCQAGYFCNPGSTSPNSNICSPGTYSNNGSSACSNCPSGYFGNSFGLTSNFCSGPCDGGYYCASKTINKYQYMCLAGTYSSSGSSFCESCTAGKYSSMPGSKNCTICSGGYFGSQAGLTTSTCSSICSVNTYSSTDGTRCLPCEDGKLSGPGSSICSSPKSDTNTQIITWTTTLVSAIITAIIGFYIRRSLNLYHERMDDWRKHVFAFSLIEKINLDIPSPLDKKDLHGAAFLAIMDDFISLCNKAGIDLQYFQGFNEDSIEAAVAFSAKYLHENLKLVPLRWYICWNVFNLQLYSINLEKLRYNLPYWKKALEEYMFASNHLDQSIVNKQAMLKSPTLEPKFCPKHGDKFFNHKKFCQECVLQGKICRFCGALRFDVLYNNKEYQICEKCGNEYDSANKDLVLESPYWSIKSNDTPTFGKDNDSVFVSYELLSP